jgi:hypothetical protein
MLMSLPFSLCIACIMRLVVTYRTFFITYDVTWEGEGIYLWTVIEIYLGIVCASLPCLKIFFGRYFDGSQASSGKRSYGSSGKRSYVYSGERSYVYSGGSAPQHGYYRQDSTNGDDKFTDIELGKGIKKTTNQQSYITTGNTDVTRASGIPSTMTFYDDDSSETATPPIPPSLQKKRYEIWEL